MAIYRAVCGEDELPPGTARRVDLDGVTLGVFHAAAGGLYAMEDTCLHAGGPLHEGTMQGTTVTCPWHGWQYDLRDGSCTLNPCVHLKTYRVRIRDGVVEVSF